MELTVLCSNTVLIGYQATLKNILMFFRNERATIFSQWTILLLYDSIVIQGSATAKWPGTECSVVHSRVSLPPHPPWGCTLQRKTEDRGSLETPAVAASVVGGVAAWQEPVALNLSPCRPHAACGPLVGHDCHIFNQYYWCLLRFV